MVRREPWLRPRVVLLDGRCPLCLRTGRILRALDVFDRLTFVDANDAVERVRYAPNATLDDVRREILVADDCGVYAGIAAFRAIARAIPLLWPLLPLLRAPGAGALSQRIYAFVARHRRLCAGI